MTNTSSSLGCLKVRVIKGIDLAARDRFRRSSDPYVVLMLDNQVVRTRTLKRNLNPFWNEELTVRIPNSALQLKLQVKDEDLFMDDRMGDAQIDLQPFVNAVRRLRDLRRTKSIDEISKLVRKDSFLLSNDGRIRYDNGNIFQDERLRLQNVECGELELQLKWVETGLE